LVASCLTHGPRSVRILRGDVSRERGDHAALIRSVHAGDPGTALSAYSPDTEWDDTRFRPEGKIHRGRDELAELVRTWVGTWRDYSFKLERIVDAGDRVVLIYEEQGTGKGSGLEIATQVGSVITVEGRQITRTVVYSDPGDALEAAGLRA
jgi:ketosteroid isomerase-like protein